MSRLNTKLESEGAEFLVLGNLLLEGISAFKAYTNFPGYDLIVTNADNHLSARIQVKSRYITDWNGFIIKNYDCDFVILVALNRGYGKGKKKNEDTGIKDPEFFIFPISYILRVRDPKNDWGKIAKSRLVGMESYKNNWGLIKSFINGENKLQD